MRVLVLSVMMACVMMACVLPASAQRFTSSDAICMMPVPDLDVQGLLSRNRSCP
jgi:hypothetical protein